MTTTSNKNRTRSSSSTKNAIQLEEFNRRMHFLELDFKHSLRDYRWKWLVPEKLDRAINPCLCEVEDAFDVILTPTQFDKIRRKIKKTKNLRSSIHFFAKLTGLKTVSWLDSGETPRQQLVRKRLSRRLVGELKNRKGDTQAREIVSDAVDFAVRLLDHMMDLDQHDDEDKIQNMWPHFQQVTELPSRNDLGETQDDTLPWVMPLDQEYWDEHAEDNPRVTRHFHQSILQCRKGLSGHFLVYVRPGFSKDDFEEIKKLTGMKKPSGGSSKRLLINDGEDKISALRWRMRSEDAQAEAKSLNYPKMTIQDIIAKLITPPDFTSSDDSDAGTKHKPNTVADWWKDDEGPLKKAREQLGLKLLLKP